MTSKYSNRSFKTIIIWILSIILLIVMMFYFAKGNQIAIEKQKLFETNIYLYELEVDRPLGDILKYLGVEPYENIDWEKEEIIREDLSVMFIDLVEGIYNFNSSRLKEVPKKTNSALSELRGKVYSLLFSIQDEAPINEKTKEEIMDFSETIWACHETEYYRSWKDVNAKIECINNESSTDGNKE